MVDEAVGDLLLDPPSREPWQDEETAVSSLRRAIEESTAAVSTDDLAIAFSGGVDSAILAALLDAPLYVAGFPDSHDVEAARSGAATLDRSLTVVELSHENIVDAIPRVVEATGRANAMDVAIALPLVLAAERVATDGFDRLAVGQGADELFGGYAKVAKAPEDPRVEADTVAGARNEVLEGLPAQLDRDVAGIRSAGVEPVCPYLTEDVVEAALRLPGSMLVREGERSDSSERASDTAASSEGDRSDPSERASDTAASSAGERKWALRRVASAWLPAELVDRDKKAMQYGSLVSRELDRLARQDGFKRRMDDHVDQYIVSLLD